MKFALHTGRALVGALLIAAALSLLASNAVFKSAKWIGFTVIWICVVYLLAAQFVPGFGSWLLHTLRSGVCP